LARFLARRLLNYVVLLFVAVTACYFLAATQLHPRQLYELHNPPLSQASINLSLDAYNLNDHEPVIDRYFDWLGGVIHGDWGKAPKGASVNQEISNRVWVSLRLVTLGSIFGIVIGVIIGAWTATRQYKFSDHTITFMSLILISAPTLVIAIVLQILATKFNSATGTGFFEFLGETGRHAPGRINAWGDRFQHLLLPTITLALGGIATFSRIQRNVMLDTLGADYVRTAQAKGLTRRKAVFKHALRTALIPTGTYFAFTVALLFTGATFTERIFGWRGMGIYGVSTIQGQDPNGTVAVAAFAGVCVLFGGLLSDVFVAILDPRVRK
jgi:peptide/nickel transport system permease protein